MIKKNTGKNCSMVAIQFLHRLAAVENSCGINVVYNDK
jgi:hypothetical protein